MNRERIERTALKIADAWGEMNPEGMRQARRFVQAFAVLSREMSDPNEAAWTIKDRPTAEVVDIAPLRTSHAGR